jgi:hypothetical protein
MQNRATNKSTEQQNNADWLSKQFACAGILNQENRNRYNERELADKAQDHVQENVEAFLLANLELLLL